MSRNSVLKVKSFEFAVRVVNLYKFLKKNNTAYELAGQLLRAGTAIGAMVREAEHASSRKDFAHKLSIGLKEANETIFWIELLFATGHIDKRMFESISKDATELLKMLIASIKTTRTNESAKVKVSN